MKTLQSRTRNLVTEGHFDTLKEVVDLLRAKWMEDGADRPLDQDLVDAGREALIVSAKRMALAELLETLDDIAKEGLSDG